MSLDVKRLAKVRELASGVVQAQCPACAEGGGDRKGEHLRVYPDGRYGCCVHPNDREHRRRIHALAGDKTRRVIKVRVAAAKSGGDVQGGILGRLGRVFGSPAVAYSTIGSSDASDGVSEVQPGPVEAVQPPRTPRTGVSESKQGGSGLDASDGVPQVQTGAAEEARTLRTGYSESNQGAVDAPDNSRTLRTPLNPYKGEELFFGDEEEEYCTYKEFAPPVRSVREEEAGPEAELESLGGVRGVRGAVAAAEPAKPAEGEARLPFFDTDGTLRIPFDSPERYHWWKPPHDQRLRVKEIIAELKARQEEAAHGAAF
jgi:hypothetical protein